VRKKRSGLGLSGESYRRSLERRSSAIGESDLPCIDCDWDTLHAGDQPLQKDEERQLANSFYEN
jgi:hypothetical protein